MEKEKWRFQKLTPVNNIDLTVYEAAFRFVFENPDIRNVAVSGTYCAGKSSVLASFQEKHRELRFLTVSLAHFQADGGEKEKEVRDTVLEGKILNQLLHQIPPENIAQTNFRIKRNAGQGGILKDAALLSFFMLSLLYLLFFPAWRQFTAALPDNWLKTVLQLFANSYSLLAGGVLFAALAAAGVYTLVKAQKNRNILRRINLQGNEIEIFEECDDSYFDKYLNEVLYLFENAGADAIVFEDMDRFNGNRIFERLREVNTLVNARLTGEKKAPLRFFYLLRDDLFTSKDRTKFFDYIVPVIPVADSSNSYDLFLKLFEQGGLTQRLQPGFLQGISLYIDDMRILKNIYNEFLIYESRLNTTELDDNRLLAVIVYKNLFPRDFGQLQLNRGMVFTLFNSKEALIGEGRRQLLAEKEEKQKLLEAVRSEHLKSVKELELVFDARRPSSFYAKQPLKKEDQAEFDARKEALEARLSNREPELEQETARLERELLLLQSRPLKELLTRENADLYFKVSAVNELGDEEEFKDVKGSEYFALLKYLIRNGYLDETYPDYISYFYENSLSRGDKVFLRSITDKRAKEYGYPLKSPASVAARLRPADFEQEEALNFDLLQFLLAAPGYSDGLTRLLQQIKKKRSFTFLGAYYDTGRELPAFIRSLTAVWPEFFRLALAQDGMSQRQLKQFSYDMLSFCGDECLLAVNENHCLTDYISSCPDYLARKGADTAVLEHGFLLLQISFHRIDYDGADPELFRMVCRNCLYEMNMENVVLLLMKAYGAEKLWDLQHRTYTMILRQPDSELAGYVARSCNAFVDEAVKNCDGVIRDEEAAVLGLLNLEGLEAGRKLAYLEVLQTPVAAIGRVGDSSLWEWLLKRRLAVYSAGNILCYFSLTHTIDDTLASFLNSREDDLDFSEAENYCGEECAVQFFEAVNKCEELSVSRYRQILITSGRFYQSFDETGLSAEKMRVLIEGGLIEMNAGTLRFLRKNYAGEVIAFIRLNTEKYLKLLTEALFSFEELKELLTWDLEEQDKLKLLGFAKRPLPVMGKGYSEAVVIHILKYNLYREELSDLFASYEEWSGPVRQSILQLASSNLHLLTVSQEKSPPLLLEELFGCSSLDNGKKTELLLAVLPSAERNTCLEYLRIMGLTEYLKLFRSHSRPRFPMDAVNKRLLTAFQKYNWIRDFLEDPDKPGYYKVIKLRNAALSRQKQE